MFSYLLASEFKSFSWFSSFYFRSYWLYSNWHLLYLLLSAYFLLYTSFIIIDFEGFMLDFESFINKFVGLSLIPLELGSSSFILFFPNSFMIWEIECEDSRIFVGGTPLAATIFCNDVSEFYSPLLSFYFELFKYLLLLWLVPDKILLLVLKFL